MRRLIFACIAEYSRNGQRVAVRELVELREMRLIVNQESLIQFTDMRGYYHTLTAGMFNYHFKFDTESSV